MMLMEWYNEPQEWAAQGNTVTVTSDAKTDFWRKTHCGSIRDNGHFFFQAATGDFIAEVKFSGEYTDLYDQAGLMVRVDEAHWIKCGIEFVEGVQHVSAVVTRDYSDWSVVPLLQKPSALWLRVTRKGSTIEVHYSLDGDHYSLLRVAHLATAETVHVGLMCASPEGSGFSTTFEGLTVQGVFA
jgi:regulation of enolase protein 1 (concanavalin A-like superfamily)